MGLILHTSTSSNGNFQFRSCSLADKTDFTSLSDILSAPASLLLCKFHMHSLASLCGKMFHCLLTQVIRLSHGSDAVHLGHVDVVKTTRWSSKQASEWGRKATEVNMVNMVVGCWCSWSDSFTNCWWSSGIPPTSQTPPAYREWSQILYIYIH